MDEFKQLIEEQFSIEDAKLIQSAYDFAQHGHAGQLRESGDPYIVHPLQVAKTLIKLGLDAETVTASLLHDLVEDTKCSLNDIKKKFGQNVADMVEGVTKLGKLEYQTRAEQQAENLRKMFLAMARNVRVVLIKLADRLHNMHTLSSCPEEKRERIARETLEIYAPLAHRLGISSLKSELEDLSFRYLNPEAYYDLKEKVSQKRSEREDVIQQIISAIRNKLEEAGIESDIEGRVKHFYSIYCKMMEQNRSFEQIFDIFAVRVLVKNQNDCYAALGIVHTMWKPMPGRFKDYIAVPKQNMYQSLHTTVLGSDGVTFEIQIRTHEMHKTAEFGIAAHWKYKEGSTQNATDLDKKLAWLRGILDWQSDVRDAQEFVDQLKVDLFEDEVFVFSPKGDVYNLLVGSIPIDFAYMIHSEVGNKCVGARINGKMVPLDTKLKTGDIVEIITSNTSKGPSRDWISIVRTSQAKSRIRQFYKNTFKEEYVEKGREILENQIRRHGYSVPQLVTPALLDKVCIKFSLKKHEDIFAAIGYGGVTAGQVIMKLEEEYNRENKTKPIVQELLHKTQEKEQGKSAPKIQGRSVRVKGELNMLVRLARCCNPVPGDEIIGYITRGRGVSIHRRSCSNLKNISDELERIVDVSWESNDVSEFQVDLHIAADDRTGLLADVSNANANMKVPIVTLNARKDKTGQAIIDLTITVKHIDQLQQIVKQIKKVRGVKDVFRTNT